MQLNSQDILEATETFEDVTALFEDSPVETSSKAPTVQSTTEAAPKTAHSLPTKTEITTQKPAETKSNTTVKKEQRNSNTTINKEEQSNTTALRNQTRPKKEVTTLLTNLTDVSMRHNYDKV